jgi:hypothetical protein
LRGNTFTVFGQRREAASSEELSAPSHLLSQPIQEPDPSWHVGGPGHHPDVWQSTQRAHRPGTTVDGMQVHLIRREPAGQ